MEDDEKKDDITEQLTHNYPIYALTIDQEDKDQISGYFESL